MKYPLILAALLLSSCTAPNLSAPTVSFVSEQGVPNPDGAARAFRVDIEEKERRAPKARYTLSPISLDERGLVPQQFPLLPTSDIEMVERIFDASAGPFPPSAWQKCGKRDFLNFHVNSR